MNEEIIMGWIFGFFSFVFGIIKSIVEFAVGCTLFIGLLYVTGRYFVCKNDSEEWSEFCDMVREAIKDLARTFRDAMPGVHASVKQWADEKINKKG